MNDKENKHDRLGERLNNSSNNLDNQSRSHTDLSNEERRHPNGILSDIPIDYASNE